MVIEVIGNVLGEVMTRISNLRKRENLNEVKTYDSRPRALVPSSNDKI